MFFNYRAKTLDTNEWVYGNAIKINPDRCFIILCDAISDDFIAGETVTIVNKEKIVEVDPKTVQLCTNLYDVKNQIIYEGDIIECTSWNEYFSITTGDTNETSPFKRLLVVVFNGNGFKMMEQYRGAINPSYFDMICDGDCEIIGNVVDNPEMAVKSFTEVNNI